MKWGDYENSVAVMVLYKSGKSTSEIFQTLRKLKISRTVMYQTIQQFIETGSIKDHSRTDQTHTAGKAVAAHNN